MGKGNDNSLVGQPIFAQVLKLINRNEFNRLVKKNASDRYYKQFKTWEHFVTLMYGILNRCDSVTEIYEGMIGCVGKLNHFGISKPPAKSTITDGNRERSSKFFEDLYYHLVKRYSKLLSASRDIKLTIKDLFIIDSTTIQMFSDLLYKGVGRNPKNNGKKKGGLKVHMLIDALQDVAQFIKISAARMHDRQFLKQLILKPFSMVVFDKAYNDYKLFASWTQQKIWFVTRMKNNAVYEVVATKYEAIVAEKEKGVLKEEHIYLHYKESKKAKELLLRRVTYKDEKDRAYVFITNNFEISAQEVADIYKQRWQIETLFKKMKQNFQLHYFYGETENAICTQIWCTLIAQLLVTVLQAKTKTKKAFSTVASIIRQHLLSYLNIEELLKNSKRLYDRMRKFVDYSDSLFPDYGGGWFWIKINIC